MGRANVPWWLAGWAWVLLLVVTLSVSITSIAHAHALGHEADVNNNRVITYCNPNNVYANYVDNAAQSPNGWNKYNAQFGARSPNLTKVSSTSYPECELRIVRTDLPGSLLGQYSARRGQDILRLDVARLDNQPDRVKQFIVSHELGHTLGLAHPGDGSGVSCAESVMKPGQDCTTANVSRFPQEHDANDIRNAWVNDPIYPNTADWQRDLRIIEPPDIGEEAPAP